VKVPSSEKILNILIDLRGAQIVTGLGLYVGTDEFVADSGWANVANFNLIDGLPRDLGLAGDLR
jgi:hypothetical protein